MSNKLHNIHHPQIYFFIYSLEFIVQLVTGRPGFPTAQGPLPVSSTVWDTGAGSFSKKVPTWVVDSSDNSIGAITTLSHPLT